MLIGQAQLIPNLIIRNKNFSRNLNTHFNYKALCRFVEIYNFHNKDEQTINSFFIHSSLLFNNILAPIKNISTVIVFKKFNDKFVFTFKFIYSHITTQKQISLISPFDFSVKMAFMF